MRPLLSGFGLFLALVVSARAAEPIDPGEGERIGPPPPEDWRVSSARIAHAGLIWARPPGSRDAVWTPEGGWRKLRHSRKLKSVFLPRAGSTVITLRDTAIHDWTLQVLDTATDTHLGAVPMEPWWDVEVETARRATVCHKNDRVRVWDLTTATVLEERRDDCLELPLLVPSPSGALHCTDGAILDSGAPVFETRFEAEACTWVDADTVLFDGPSGAWLAREVDGTFVESTPRPLSLEGICTVTDGGVICLQDAGIFRWSGEVLAPWWTHLQAPEAALEQALRWTDSVKQLDIEEGSLRVGLRRSLGDWPIDRLARLLEPWGYLLADLPRREGPRSDGALIRGDTWVEVTVHERIPQEELDLFTLRLQARPEARKLTAASPRTNYARDQPPILVLDGGAGPEAVQQVAQVLTRIDKPYGSDPPYPAWIGPEATSETEGIEILVRPEQLKAATGRTEDRYTSRYILGLIDRDLRHEGLSTRTSGKSPLSRVDAVAFRAVPILVIVGGEVAPRAPVPDP